MNTVDTLGGAAGFLTTISFIPQVYKVWKTRHTKDISLGMYAIFTSGVGFWLIYGYLLTSWPIIVSNGITFVLAGTVLLMKIRFD